MMLLDILGQNIELLSVTRERETSVASQRGQFPELSYRSGKNLNAVLNDVVFQKLAMCHRRSQKANRTPTSQTLVQFFTFAVTHSGETSRALQTEGHQSRGVISRTLRHGCINRAITNATRAKLHLASPGEKK